MSQPRPSINYLTLFSGALGLTLALAWNDAVSQTVKALLPANARAAACATLVYAIVVTILVIFVVAAVNHARRLAHGFRTARPAGFGPGRAPPPAASLPGPAGAGGGWGAAASDLDCHACVARCGPAPIVQFWEPAREPAREPPRS